MSNSTNRNLFFDRRYTNYHVGGTDNSNNGKYFKDQSNIINDNIRMVPPKKYNTGVTNNTKDDKVKALYPENDDNVNRYDPYYGHLYKKGLLYDGEPIKRYVHSYIHIDSRDRNKIPSASVSVPYHLQNDPIKFTIDTNEIYINHINNNYTDGSLVSITGVLSTNSTLNTYIDGNVPINNQSPFTILNASFYIHIGSDIMGIRGINHNIPNFIDNYDVYVEIIGIRGDDTLTNKTSLGNIPINAINGIHKIYTTITSSYTDNWYNPNTYASNVFYIKLSNKLLTPGYKLDKYNYRVSFNTLSGIQLNFINAYYPLSANTLQGYHTIYNVSDNGYNIKLNSNNSINTINGGGNNVYVSLVEKIEQSYPNPNKYSITLDKIYQNVVTVKLLSIEFPNTERVVTDEQYKQNNKIYWNNYEDGSYVYSIEIPPGNYDSCNIIKVIEELFYNTEREFTKNIKYETNHCIKMDIDNNTDIVTFKSYRKYKLMEPFTTSNVTTDIMIPVTQPIIIKINNPDHLMDVAGETIIITGAIEYLGISEDIINGKHIVKKIIDKDNYEIELPIINVSDIRDDNNGGMSVIIFIPSKFRLLFNYNDTIGELLGWRNVGDQYSITSFKTSISNNEPYEVDVTIDSFGNPINITNNPVMLCGDNYVYMTVKPLETCYCRGDIKNIFAKILLYDKTNKIIFNNYVNMHKIYDNPLYELSELEISFYNYRGLLYNFYGIEHSFTLEIVCINDSPEDTNISANTGRIYNIDYKN